MVNGLIWGWLLLSCEEEEVNYNQFNSTTDTMEISVGASEELDLVEISLFSSTGLVVVGSASIDPGGGPIGTRHTLVVEVDDTWETQVSRVVVVTESGERGAEEFTLARDSADAGYHQIDIVSVGEAGEMRTDTLTIQLYTEEGSNISSVDTGTTQ